MTSFQTKWSYSKVYQIIKCLGNLIQETVGVDYGLTKLNTEKWKFRGYSITVQLFGPGNALKHY